MKTYGRVTLDGNFWRVEAQPHIIIRLKRLFEKIDSAQQGVVTLSNCDEHCRDLEWFLDRFPLSIDFSTRAKLKASAARHVDHLRGLEEMLDPDYTPRAFPLALPAREYQRRAAELYLAQGFLLLADDVGLGKTCSAICSLADARTLPAVVVTKTALPAQWAAEIKRFAPHLYTYCLRTMDPLREEIPRRQGRGPDVIILSYHKLSTWAQVLAAYCKSAIYDEVQELRRDESDKYRAAEFVARSVKFSIGLSATPIYNYGGEFFNVLNILRPGILGTREEFYRGWCVRQSDHWSIADPEAFGTYLREHFMMLRRTRAEVGRELPPVQKIAHRVDSDRATFTHIEHSAADLARIILSHHEERPGEKRLAAGKLDALLRQATGVAKAPYVADFVRMLVENGERVLLGGWHRDVYAIWHSELKDLRLGYYTGTESTEKKLEAKRKFIDGELDVLIMSLRSGEGIDGLQGTCRNVVLGELDWAAGVHEQFIGRIHRDGQASGVNAYFLISDSGSDPIMVDVLGLKREQLEGVRNPNRALIEPMAVDHVGHVKRLAEMYLRKVAS
jgi:SNF2 family DNA or RNA helicase